MYIPEQNGSQESVGGFLQAPPLTSDPNDTDNSWDSEVSDVQASGTAPARAHKERKVAVKYVRKRQKPGEPTRLPTAPPKNIELLPRAKQVESSCRKKLRI